MKVMPTLKSSVPRSATWLRAFALLAVLGSVALLAQTPAKFDKAALTKYVLYLERWPADAQVTLSDPKPAADLPGWQEVVVERTRLGRVVAQRLLLPQHRWSTLFPGRYLPGERATL
jgi:hypothetical protein